MAKRSKKKKTAGKAVTANVAKPASIAVTMPPWSNRDWLWGLILVLAVILAYSPVWWAGYIWDDDVYITDNPCMIGLRGLAEIWTTSAADISPLTFTTFWVEHALWGLAPLPYHLVNVLLHGACAVVLWRVLRSLQVPGAWLGAALWALHPVEVESVAWITEMKNTQSGLFYLLTVLFFLKGLKSPGRWDYALTLLFAFLAMASKSSTVILPVVLCLCAWWVEGRWHWRNLVKVTPIFLMSVAASALSIWTQKLNGANDPQWIRTWPERMVTAGDAVWFYLGKLLWPHPLIMIYPRWQPDTGDWISYLPLLAVIIVFFFLWLKRGTWARPWFFAFAYFLAALLPVLGLVDNAIFRYSLVFDHFQYLASMGPLALAGTGMVWLADCVIPGRSWLQSSLCAGLLLALGILSWQRSWVYESQETLWIDALAKNPTCWAGYNNLGNALAQKGQLDDAIAQFQKALEIDPNLADVCNNLGNALVQKGHVNEAMEQFQKALRINPHLAIAHNNLGLAFLQKGKLDEAIEQFQKTLEIDPDLADVYNNLGNALVQKGHVNEAMEQFQKALEIDPDDAEVYYNLGNVSAQNGKLDEAIGLFQKALEINPNYADAYNHLGLAFFKEGQMDQAIEQYQKALEIKPDYAEVYAQLGLALVQKGELNEAIGQFQKVVDINPGAFDAHYNLGLALFKVGRADEAIRQFQNVLEIKPDYADAYNLLGVAFMQKGEMDKAITSFQKAVKLKPGYVDAQNNLAKVEAMARQRAPSK